MPLNERDVRHIVEHHEEIAERVISGEADLREILKLEDEEIESMYAMAYTHYVHGKYDEAGRIFALLMILEPSSYRICLGLALSVYRSGRIDEAMLAFTHCLFLDQFRPEAHLYMAECLLHRGDREGARESLEQVMVWSEEQDGQAIFSNKARIMLDNLAAA